MKLALPTLLRARPHAYFRLFDTISPATTRPMCWPKGCGARRRLGRLPDARKTRHWKAHWLDVRCRRPGSSR